jgi:hypothetical protein
VLQREIMNLLDGEKPRNSLDMRGRLDSKGERYGEVIKFKYAIIRETLTLTLTVSSVESSRPSPPPQAARGRARPPCRHFKIQSCCCLGSAFEVSKPLAEHLSPPPLTVRGVGPYTQGQRAALRGDVRRAVFVHELLHDVQPGACRVSERSAFDS